MDDVKALQEKLFMSQKTAAATMSDDEIKVADEYSEGYKDFLFSSKTERECVNFFENEAVKRGFEKFDKSKKYNR